MKRLSRLSLIVTVFVLTCPQSSFAAYGIDRLVDKAPSDTFVLIAFEGMENTKEAFDKTTLAGIWNSPQVQSFYKTILDEILRKAKSDREMTPEEQKIFDKIKENVGLFFSRPAVLGVVLDTEEKPFVIIDAGLEKARFVELISQLEKLDDKAQIKKIAFQGKEFKSFTDAGETTFWGWDGNDFLLFIDDPKMGLASKLLSGATTQNSSKFSDFYHTDAGVSFASAYIEVEKMISLLSQDVPQSDAGKFSTVMKTLGLTDIRSCAFKMALKDMDVLVEGNVKMLDSPAGLFSFTRPVNIDMLKMLHGSSMDAMAFNYDWTACYKMVAGLIKATDAGAYTEMAAAIAKAEADLGIKIKGVLPESLAGPVTFNMVPIGQITSVPQGAFAIVAELETVGSLEQSLVALGKHFAEKSNGMLQVASEEHNGRKYHAWVAMPLAMMQLMPTWTIVDDKLVIASCKEMCFDAAERFAAGKVADDSLGNNDDFKSVLGQTHSEVWMFRYIDTEAKAKHVMTSMQRYWPMLTMGLMQNGIKLPAMLPSIDAAIKDAPPSFQYNYNDYSSVRYYYQGLGIDLNSGFGGGAGTGAMMAAILMPALGKTKELSKRLVSGTNLKGLGTACNVYAFDHDDNFPPNLEVLITECDVSPKSLESPIKPNRFTGPGYIYIAGQNGTMNSQNVLAYENPAYQTEGTNVLFVDGHSEYIRGTGAIELINATYKRLGKEPPKIEFNTFK